VTGPSFGDMLSSARGQSDRQAEIDDLPKVSRPFPSVKDQDCESGYSGADCAGWIPQGEEAAFVNDEIACGPCAQAAQDERDDYFDNL